MSHMTSAVASSSTLWAQASKEWVIPAKPKPGRKPKKDPPVPPKDETTEFDLQSDAKGRRVQNRAAQRAFRERKQSQLADLQARVHSYEQGEMERNVALQNIAKRLKEENDSLRRENLSLREELCKLRPERSQEADRKRWREHSNSSSSTVDSNMRKRIKTDLPEVSATSGPPSAISLIHSPSSLASSPESIDSTASSVPNDPYSPLSFSGRSPPSSIYQHNGQQSAMVNFFSGFPGKVPGCTNENRAQASIDQTFDMVDCGFCSDDTPCVCRELALQQVAARVAVSGEVPGSGPSIPSNSVSTATIGHLSPSEVKMESQGSISVTSTPQMPPATVPVNNLSCNTRTSILDNLPAYSPPVPLPRLRQAGQTSNGSVFTVLNPPSARSVSLRQSGPVRDSANCSGDPSNCLACADDPFGKAFCAALVAAKACSGCPKDNSLQNVCSKGYCGNSENCNGCGSSGEPTSPSSGSTTSSSTLPAYSPNQGSSSSGEKIPCNTAWAQLKSHPNIAFTDLTLLAEVVARRSKCTGPRVVLSPDPEMEALAHQQTDGISSANQSADDMSVLLTDPHARYHENGHSNNSGPQSPTSPREILQCARQRVREVEADGVRDALAILDGRYRRN